MSDNGTPSCTSHDASGVAHDPRRETADARGLYSRVPNAVPEVPVVHRAALRAVNTSASRGRPVISADMPSRMCGGTGAMR